MPDDLSPSGPLRPGDEQLPAELVAMLRRLAGREGVDLGEAFDGAPVVRLDVPVRALSQTLGDLVASKGIFRMGRQVVTVGRSDSGAAESCPMDANRWCSWAEEFCVFQKADGRSGEVRVVSCGKDLAAKVLAADVFVRRLPVLWGVNSVRLPVLRESGEVELLKKGYDEGSGIWSDDAVPFAKDWDLERSCGWWAEALGEFPWAVSAGRDGAETADVRGNRSAAVAMAGALAVFCRGLFPPGTPRPVFYYGANQQGSGKTLLAKLALAPVVGGVAGDSLPRNDDEFEKKLGAVAQGRLPYLFLDDLSGVWSRNFNRFVTEQVHQGRVLGGQQLYHEPNVTMCLVTGNNLELSSDVARRALCVELFVPGETGGRKFAHALTDRELVSPRWRSEALAALWGIVRAWAEAGAPQASNTLAGFEDVTGALGGMLAVMGWGDPLAAPDLPMGGDSEDREWREVLAALAERVPGGGKVEFTMDEIVEEARSQGALVGLVGSGSKELQGKDRQRLGHALRRWRGRVLTDSVGRVFEFGHRKQARQAVFPCRVMGDKPAPRPAQDAASDSDADW